MAEPESHQLNGGMPAERELIQEDEPNFIPNKGPHPDHPLNLYAALRRLIADAFFRHRDHANPSPLLHRIKNSVSQNIPLLQEATRKTTKDVLLWTRSGSPLRPLLVISLGTVALLTSTGLLIFGLFFLAATVNAIIISLLMSLAAAGGFLALFFASVTVIYIGALSVAVFVISTATISAIIAVMIASGWIGFFLVVWLVIRKSFGLAKGSLTATSTALLAYSVMQNRHVKQ